MINVELTEREFHSLVHACSCAIEKEIAVNLVYMDKMKKIEQFSDVRSKLLRLKRKDNENGN